MKKILIISLISFFTLKAAYSQEVRHELSVYGMGGMSTLQYDLKGGDQKAGFGGGIGVGYSYRFTEMIGINTGLELSFYNAKGELNSLTTAYNAKDFDGDTFILKSKVSKYEEKQNAMYLNIPIMANFRFPVANHQFYASGGFKLGIPLNGQYEPTGGTFKNTGYYSYEDYEYDNNPALGFGETYGGKDKEDFDTKFSVQLGLEAGMKFAIAENNFLGVGIYFDYGLNSITKEGNKQFIEYNTANPTQYLNNGLFQSQFSTDTKTSTKFVDKVRPMAVGLKVTFGFNL